MSKYLPPTVNGALKNAYIKELVKIEKLLEECNGDIDLWCDRLGLELVRSNAITTPPITAYLFGKIIFIREGLTKKEELKSVTHEYAHYMFHAATTPHETMNVFAINRDEREARAFAAAISKKEFFT